MIIAPLQVFLGDVIYTVRLIREMFAGEVVVWGVQDNYVEGLNRAYPDITFVPESLWKIDYDIREDVIRDGIRYIPLRWADWIMKVPYNRCMAAKYEMYGLDCTDWKCEYEVTNPIQLDLPSKYNLINQNYRADGKGFKSIRVDNGLPNIYMNPVGGHSMFDWTYVIANATNIHTVSTSLFYLLEMIDLKADEVHLYDRGIEGQGIDNIEYLFTKKYIIHE